ncbi:hypothetical protein A2738_01775 [Candidatus Nomurabacteria bacterium RIFCSPHIGHO2_01_FULL_42_15]|uniref:Uncharacterized protein n=1 Tax=Candidatus Nomurabacteria bacterium RIFCSPHIGHO2_01_FULL_42_15 TaxID=1801742 RepID=A0A1F6VG89_9BACT|nr:MAG: hypothetical protein A2738_01775 [Candidatus Nomurabacteria bacterium RIFCSPHIGHO2_01_FULL_42_15]OGI92985.1 MAG: hypothetical protein A3A99_00395 [Candidatus Nomurabacteria bacterium RIFCSPLOWO2_01_FULL_41_18]
MGEKFGGTTIAPEEEMPPEKADYAGDAENNLDNVDNTDKTERERTDDDVAVDLAEQMYHDSIQWLLSPEERVVIERLIEIIRGDKKKGKNNSITLDVVEKIFQDSIKWKLTTPPADRRVIEELIKLARKKE